METTDNMTDDKELKGNEIFSFNMWLSLSFIYSK